MDRLICFGVNGGVVWLRFTLVCLLAVLVDVPEFIFQGQRGSWPPSPWHQKLMHPNHPITACPLQTAIDYGWTY